MILPSKYLLMEMSLLGQAATILTCRQDAQTVSGLWSRARAQRPNLTFARFSEALTLLYSLGAVESVNGLLMWERS